jgi:peptidoglycan/LPS O-acetylase OafA/YrhL
MVNARLCRSHGKCHISFTTSGSAMNPATSDFLNASRWIAAFFVVFQHVFNTSITYYDIVEPSLFLRAVHFFGDFGHIAVIVFFVISGYLVGGRAILNLKDKGFSIKDYSVHRFTRIYIVLIPALIIGYLLDWSGIVFFNASGIYNDPPGYGNPFGNDLTKHLSLGIFVGNLLQLQTITVSSLGSNVPLWSLANEWWYYVLFGFFMIAYRSGRVLTQVVASCAILAIITALPLGISLWFVLWCLGVAVGVLDRYWRGWSFTTGATILVACLIAVRLIERWRLGMAHGLAADFAVDLAAALGYSIVLPCAKNLSDRLKFPSLHRALASFSYTVYLVHFPAMVFLAAFMNDVLDIGFTRQPDVATMVYAGTLLAMIYGYAWIFAEFTEAHTDTVRSRLSLLVPALFYRVRQVFARIYS